MRPLGIPKDEPCVYNHRRRLPPEIYEDNYSYAMNYYQPMLDYLDAREKGEQRDPPHLPWVCERGYPRYDTKRPVFRYPQRNVAKLADRAERLAKDYLPDFRFDIKRSMFSIRSTAVATRLNAHIKDVSFMERIEKRLQERNERLGKVLDVERQKRVKLLEKRLKEAYEQTEFDFSDTVKEALKGKNEKKIAKILWHDSLTRQLQSNYINENARKEYEEQRRQLAQKWPEVFVDGDGNTKSSEARWVARSFHTSVDIIKGALNEYSRQIKELNEINLAKPRWKIFRE